MLLTSILDKKGLHPLLESTADLIRFNRSNITELMPLDLAPELQSIYKKMDDEHLLIVNELHQSRGFRKLHLELARIGPSLEILHCVFFPDPRFNLPIFGVDIVSISNTISAAIVDLSPVGDDLPKGIKDLITVNKLTDFSCVRDLPSWGDIFSPYVCFIKPESELEEDKFLEITANYLRSILSYAISIKPDSLYSPSTQERYKYQHTYCLKQKLNDKTRNVLSKAFSSQWADRYIDIVLFECSPLPTK